MPTYDAIMHTRLQSYKAVEIVKHLFRLLLYANFIYAVLK